jgi:hypothetical protein
VDHDIRTRGTTFRDESRAEGRECFLTGIKAIPREWNKWNQARFQIKLGAYENAVLMAVYLQRW